MNTTNLSKLDTNVPTNKMIFQAHNDRAKKI